MFLTRVSIRKPVLMTMGILALIIFGLVGYFSLPIDLMPNIELPYVTVQTIYQGAGPEEIETSILRPVEEQMSTVSNVKTISSFAAEGIGFVILEFNLGVDPDLAAIDVKDKIDAILFELPRDMMKPVIGKFDINAQPILNLALTGLQSPEELRRIADKVVKERLVKIGGVASATIVGGREREIHIDLHKHRLDGLNLSIQTIAGIIAAQTANIPGGHISGARKEFTVRVQGQFENLNEIRNMRVPVSSREGVAMVPLSTVGDIVDTYGEVRQLARFNGQNSVGLSILKRPDGNTVAVAADIFKAIDALNKELPEGTKINIAQDRSQFIKTSVNDMYVNMLIGMGLTALMLLLFLGDWRVTIIAALTIPASIIITLMGMQALDFSLNIMTLMALAISVGTLVTNAIIVLENVVRHRNTGMPIREASEVGANEVFTAVFASVLTNVAVFIPMANMEGITGQFFKSLGLTIVIATVASLFLSFTLAPLMASRLLKNRSPSDDGKKKGLEAALDRFSEQYGRILELSMDHRYIVVFLTLLLFIGTLAGIGPRIGLEFFPQGDQGVFTINLEMPTGTSFAETDRMLSIIEQRVSRIPELESVYSSLGGSGSNTGVNFADLTVRLKDAQERSRTTRQVVDEIRPLLADIPDALIVVKEAQAMGGGQTEGDIQVEITGDRMEEILAIADTVKNMAAAMEGLVDARTSWKEAKPEIKFIPNRLMLDEYGVSVLGMGFALRNSLTGSDQTVFRDGNDEYKIRVQYREDDRNTIDAVENISIQTRGQGLVPIKALNSVRTEGGAANINRKNRQRMVTVSANVGSGAVGTRASELKARTDNVSLKPGYRIHFGGQQERMAESFGTLGMTMLLAILLTYMVLAASIESLTQPILIMVTIPLGLIGVFWALFLTGRSISMLSLMSVVMLIGVVVNNAILIIDYAHKRQKEGLSSRDAMLDACKVKFSAVLMMNMAVVLALFPQAIASQSIQSPFAITAIGGIVVSTVMTLLVIPAMYLFTAGKKRLE